DYTPEIPEIGVKLGETKSLHVDISNLPGGLRVARVVVTSSGSLTFDNLRVLNPNYFEILEQSKELLTFRVGDFDREIPPGTGRLNLAEIGISAEKVGRTKVEVKLTLWTDEGELVKTSGSAPVNVGVGSIGNSSAPPTDPNGDGMYEDIDGDGEVTETDAFLLAFNLDSPALQNNPELFDFNRDGKITFDDAIELIRLLE
ncbi:MAG: dockerin type I domain-containing protein, partial [Candidatus Bipolaricaulota bacterium]